MIMRTVWKQELKLTAERQDFTMRGFEKVVYVAEQRGVITLWFLADPESAYHDQRAFQIFGTGDTAVPDKAEHLGSVQMGWYVWHVFEVPIPEEEHEFLDSSSSELHFPESWKAAPPRLADA
jgi:hypothetical protein